MAETPKQNHHRPGFSKTRVGLFGGTFNPVHIGHVAIARDVKAGFKLDKILVIPSATPPHKKNVGIVNAEDRLHMARLSFEKEPGFEISDVELRREGPSYTMDTVTSIIEGNPADVDFHLIVGTDAFFEIHTWHRYTDILESIKLIVMTRPGDSMETSERKQTRAGNYLKTHVSEGYRWNQSQKEYNHTNKKPILFYDVTQLTISSTQIRQYIIENSCTAVSFLNTDVAAYIKEKGLYK